MVASGCFKLGTLFLTLAVVAAPLSRPAGVWPASGSGSVPRTYLSVFLLDHACIVLALLVFGLGAWAAVPAALPGPDAALAPPASEEPAPHPRRRSLRTAGGALVWLSAWLFVLGGQMFLLTARGGFTWLVNLGIALCSVPVFLAGRELRRTADRRGRAVTRAALWTGWTLHLAHWLCRMAGAGLVALSVYAASVTLARPGADRLAFLLVLALSVSAAAVGVVAFRLGAVAGNAARRQFGLATSGPSRRLSTAQKLRVGSIQLTSLATGTAGLAVVLVGLRLAVGDLVAMVSHLSSPHTLLLDLMSLCVGGSDIWVALAGWRVAQRLLGTGAGNGAPLPRRRRVYGWALRTASWAMRLAGTAVLILAVLGMKSVSTIPDLPGYHGPPWYILLVIFLLVGTGGAAVLVFASVPTMKANRYLANIVTSPEHISSGSYVLYLRPFDQDAGASEATPLGKNLNFFNNPGTWIMQSHRSHEERISALFAEFGPLLAVGSPGEQVPGGAGAARMYLPLDDWKGTVGRLIENAGVIVMGTGPGPGTLWEYAEVLRRRHPTRLVLLVTDPIEYRRFKASSVAEAEGVLYELKSRYGESWETPLLPELPDYLSSPADRAFWFKSMVYFTSDCEPQLVSLDTSTVSGNFRMDSFVAKSRLTPLMNHLRSILSGASSTMPGQK
ncbi:hypothetical protein OHO83_09105 [Streptomyces sp. NBC_00569]|uniref:hypothetical protein n=1 Tax=Streptomyces sp. NBC_00569 TaxID=2975780 RepID=UPI002E80B5D0|nr:hypothetical protein [Streptomyces sp. NBC_00569]WUB92457.1 hypothetical protein OHO83_09105 [Streptomyces sp. NBC_00569]